MYTRTITLLPNTPSHVLAGYRVATAALDSGNALRLTFVNGAQAEIYDAGQCCCERRYMTTDDDLTALVGAHLNDIEVASVDTNYDEYGDAHEIQFLRIRTDRGVFVFQNHNEHNGYYGGFTAVIYITQ